MISTQYQYMYLVPVLGIRIEKAKRQEESMGCAVSTPMEPCEPNTPNVLTRKAEGKVGSAEEVGVLLADLTDQMTLMSMPLSIVIFGATGDLAKKKLFPALYYMLR